MTNIQKFDEIDRLEKHLECKCFSKVLIQRLFPDIKITDKAFENPKEFCDNLRSKT